MDIHVYVHEPKTPLRNLVVSMGMLYLGYKFVKACARIAKKLDEEKGATK